MSKKGAYTFKDIKFPDCAHDCAAVEYLGCGECDAVCGWKFDKDGKQLNNFTAPSSEALKGKLGK